MEHEAIQIPASSFFVITLVGHLIFAIPAIIIILVLELLQVKALLFIALPTMLIFVPGGAYFSWLMAKGSNWVNTRTAVIASSVFSGRFFSVLVGGLLGYRLYGIIGGVLFVIPFFIGANVIGKVLGEFFVDRFIPELN